MAQDPPSSDITEAGRKSPSYPLSLRPLQGRAAATHTQLPDKPHGGQPVSAETMMGRAGQAVTSLPGRLHYLRHYALALLFVAAAALVRGALGDVLDPTPFLVFYLAWVSAAAFGGLGPGLLAALASWLCVDLFFDPAPGYVSLGDAASVGRFVVFLAGGLAVSLVGEKMRRARLRERRQTRRLAAANAALRESEGKYRFLVENSKDITWTIDLQGRWTFISSNVERISGHRPEEVIGRTLWDFLAPECHDVVKEKLAQRVRGDDLPPYEVLMVGKDGRRIPFEVLAASILDGGGNIVGVQGVSRDITERKRAEEALHEWNATLEGKVTQRTEELAQRARQLQKLTLELSEAEERERERVAEILHDDLQQVLAAAKFQLSFLDTERCSPERSREIVGQVKEMLKEAIERSRHLSHELYPALLHQGDLAETFDWLAEQMQAKHGLTVRVKACGAVRTQSNAVKTLVYRAAQEMLFNIVKHAQVSEARLRVRRLGRYICLSVSDRGRGFDPGEVRQTAGFGLLSIRERVVSLGGRMTTRSARGRGAAFRIVVPDAESSAHALASEQRPDGSAPVDRLM